MGRQHRRPKPHHAAVNGQHRRPNKTQPNHAAVHRLADRSCRCTRRHGESVDSLDGAKMTDSLESAEAVLGKDKRVLAMEGSRVLSRGEEKMDSSCEESFLEVGADGTPRKMDY